MRRIPRVRSVGFLLVLASLTLAVTLTLAETASAADPTSPPPLLRWDLLRATIYRPPTVILWPEGLEAYDGKKVRLEGYIMPRFNYQDPGDLLLSALHPRSIFCGPTDMTALVEIYYPGYSPENWPELPVEVTGTFHLSRSPGNLFYLYHLRIDSLRKLRRWEQDFPGAVDELQQAEDDGR